MKPVIEWTFIIAKCIDISWKLSFKSWNHIVEWKGVSGEVDPSGMGSKESERLSWPKTIMLMPARLISKSEDRLLNHVRELGN